MRQMDLGVAFAERLASLGCRFALDDFGTGYASFTYLKRLPVDYLKIDREFVRELAGSPRDRHVVQAIVNLARGFGPQTIAEGVEDAETLKLLSASASTTPRASTWAAPPRSPRTGCPRRSARSGGWAPLGGAPPPPGPPCSEPGDLEGLADQHVALAAGGDDVGDVGAVLELHDALDGARVLGRRGGRDLLGGVAGDGACRSRAAPGRCGAPGPACGVAPCGAAPWTACEEAFVPAAAGSVLDLPMR